MAPRRDPGTPGWSGLPALSTLRERSSAHEIRRPSVGKRGMSAADLRHHDAVCHVTDPDKVAGRRAHNQASPAARHASCPRGRTCPMANGRLHGLSTLPRVRPSAGPAAQMPAPGEKPLAEEMDRMLAV